MECFLHCADNTHDPIALPDGVNVMVGRMPELKIKSLKCSRNQIQLTAGYKEKEVQVKQLGKQPSTVAGKRLLQGQTSTLGPGGQICLLNNEYPHFIYFKIPQTTKSPTKRSTIDNYFKSKSVDSNSSPSIKSRKRKIEETSDIEDDESFGNIDSHSSSKKNRKIKSEENDGFSKKLKSDQKDEGRLEPSLSSFKCKTQNLTDSENSVGKSPNSEQKSDLVNISPDGNKDHVNECTTSPLGTPCETSSWDEIPGELLVYTRKGVEGRSKIAGFDMDGTLITTKSGKVFPRDTGDWRILLPQIPGKLKSLWSEGYKIVIFTNQNGIAKKKVSVPEFKKKIENVVQALTVPVQVLISPGTGHYRKPSTGMWQYLDNKLNQGIKIIKTKSCYIGDAAGRPVGWAPGKKKDFSCSDRAFAANVGVDFQTPEEFFLNKKPAPYDLPAFNPRKLDVNAPLLEPSTAQLTSKEKEVIVMVGFPAAGKSTFCETYLVPEGYIRVNRDSLGTWQKCVSSCRSALNQGKSVVIDNTNPDKESRQRYVECAKEAKVPARCFVMAVDKDHAEHNNKVREALNTDKNYKPVGFMVFNTYKKSYVEPKKEEGFAEIVQVRFIPNFKTTQTKELYNQYL